MKKAKTDSKEEGQFEYDNVTKHFDENPNLNYYANYEVSQGKEGYYKEQYSQKNLIQEPKNE